MKEPLSAPAEQPSLAFAQNDNREPTSASTTSLERALRAERFAEGRAFLIALAALDGAEQGPPMHQLSAKAADALARLAELDGERELALVLRPDPAREFVTWTVACYRIGDLIPVSLRDYTNPVRAIRALARCPEEEHVAAELIASNDQGVQWCALVRSGDQLAFRLPTAETLTCSDPGDLNHTSALSAAIEHWHARFAFLERYSISPPIPDEKAREHGVANSELSALGARLDTFETELKGLIDRMSRLEARLAAHLMPEDAPIQRIPRASSTWSVFFRRRGEQ